MKFLRPFYLLGALVMAVAAYALVMDLRNNFYAVIPNEFYRSGQISAGDVAFYKEKYGIRSIINLRGENTGSKWYDTEINEAKAAGVTHIDYRMSSKHILPREESLRLIALMRDAPKPVLVHCNGGANRTSLASALYLAAVKKTDEKTAESQLSIRYGNLPRWMGSRSRMSESFEQLEDMLGYHGS